MLPYRNLTQPLASSHHPPSHTRWPTRPTKSPHAVQEENVEGCNLFYAKNTSPHLFLEDNGKIISDTLCDFYPAVKQLNPAWTGSFDIIGHSYGGLRARAFIEDEALYDGGARCPEKSYRIFVRNLVTLGTPHGGEIGNLPFAALIGAGALVDQQWPAIWEMLPPVRLVENSLARQPEGTCYYLLSGDGRLQAAVLPTLLLPCIINGQRLISYPMISLFMKLAPML